MLIHISRITAYRSLIVKWSFGLLNVSSYLPSTNLNWIGNFLNYLFRDSSLRSEWQNKNLFHSQQSEESHSPFGKTCMRFFSRRGKTSPSFRMTNNKISDIIIYYQSSNSGELLTNWLRTTWLLDFFSHLSA